MLKWGRVTLFISMNSQSEWKRNCPSCGNEIRHSSYKSLMASIRKNNKCKSCGLIGNTRCENRVPWNKGVPRTKEDCEKISKSLLGRIGTFNGKNHTDESKRKNHMWHLGRKMSVQHKLNTSKNNSKFWSGKVRSEETKHKIRISTILDLKSKGIDLGKCNYNPNACLFIDALNQCLGLTLQHARNGGEVELYGYLVDGYDAKRNVIFEYDEKSHSVPSKKKRDMIRQENLMTEINPTLFLRYDEDACRLYDATTNESLPICI